MIKLAIAVISGMALTCGVASAQQSSATTIVAFDDLLTQTLPSGYGGINWPSNWVVASPFPSPPFFAHSLPNASYYQLAGEVPDLEQRFQFVLPDRIFRGAWFSGNEPQFNTFVQFRLYNDGILVHTTQQYPTQSEPVFLASGYTGPVDTVGIYSNLPGAWVMDDFTYDAPPSEPLPKRCHPPFFIAVGTTNAVPAVTANLSNEIAAPCDRSSNIQIVNHLASLWLGLDRVQLKADQQTSKPLIVPVSAENLLEDFAPLKLIPPCRFSGVFDPVCDPGQSSWGVTFFGPSSVRFSLAITLQAASMTVLDLLFSLSKLGLTPIETIELASDLGKVPTIRQALKCFIQPFTAVTCASAELLNLTTRFKQQEDIVRIFTSRGINMTVEQLVGKAVGFPVSAVELAESLFVFGITVGTVSEDTGALTVDVEAR
jgi:hypothetical protein